MAKKEIMVKSLYYPYFCLLFCCGLPYYCLCGKEPEWISHLPYTPCPRSPYEEKRKAFCRKQPQPLSSYRLNISTLSLTPRASANTNCPFLTLLPLEIRL